MKTIFKKKNTDTKMSTDKDKIQASTETAQDSTASADTRQAEAENQGGNPIGSDNTSENEENTENLSSNNAMTIEIQTNKEEELQKQVDELRDKYLRLSAEFDNYRKRTLKERMDLIKTAGEDILINILPVIDNFERAMKAMEIAKEIEPVKEGINLIYSNFKEFILQRGIKEMQTNEQEFNTDYHEAITRIPVQDKAMAGKVVDVIQKGYFLNEKVIRFAKVVVGDN